MKLAMERIRTRFITHQDDRVRRARIANQVHDELLVECPMGVEAEILRIMCWEMENTVRLSVPIIAEGATGRSWGDAH